MRRMHTMYIYIYTRIYIYMHTYVHTHMHTYMHTDRETCIHAHTHTLHTHILIFVRQSPGTGEIGVSCIVLLCARSSSLEYNRVF